MGTDDTVTVDAGEYRKYKAAYEDAHAQYRSAKYTDAQIDAMMEKRAEDARLEMEARYADERRRRVREDNAKALEDARTAYERLAGIPAAMFREVAPDVPEA